MQQPPPSPPALQPPPKNNIWAIVEIECLRGVNETLTVKEIGLLHSNCMDSMIFKPPQTREPKESFKHNDWIRKNLNGFVWNQGNAEYEELPKILYRIAKRFPMLFTKGAEKVKMIRELIEEGRRVLGEFQGPQQQQQQNFQVINLDDIGCPRFATITAPVVRCLFHYQMPQSFQCALEKASRFHYWLENRNNSSGNANDLATANTAAEKEYYYWN